MTTPLEIERKFLLGNLPPGLEDRTPISLRQGYLVQGDNREARVRQKGDQWLLTVKDGSGLTRREVEIALSPDQGNALWPLTEGYRVVKKRYEMPWSGHLLEIDIFEDALAPLLVCEIEFDSVEAARAFMPPDFLDREVTDSVEYTNASLARRGLPANPPVGT